MQLAIRRSNPLARAFTLVELIVVIVVLAILSGVAIPAYFDYAARAKKSATQGTLGAVRSAIHNYYQSQLVNTGTGAWPTLVQVQTAGTVMQETVPTNPYNSSATIKAGVWAATPPTAGPEGWAYDAATGKFWANSATGGVNENTW